MKDEELGEALRSMLAVADPVPAAELAAASAALGWRDLDAQLATLTADSWDGEALLAVRGDEPRLLSFATGEVAIDLEVTNGPGGVSLLGQLVPAVAARILVEYAGGSRGTGADERGRFGVRGLPDRWLRVRVQGEGQARSHTEWFRA
jgi:hypothetical protein